MADNNIINSNFKQIAVTDSSDNVWGIKAAVANVQITGGTSGQVLTTNGSGNLSWATSTAIAATNIQEFTAASTGTNQTFTLSSTTITNTNGSIYVNGVLLRTSQYSISGTTLTISRSLTTGDLLTVGAIPGAVISSTITDLTAPGTANVLIGGGTSGQVLTATGTGNATSWTTVSSGWTSTTTTITATTTNPTKGTVIKDYIRYRALGNKVYQVEMMFHGGAGGSAGNGLYLFQLPGGLIVDTAYHSLNPSAVNFGSITQWECPLPNSTGMILISGSSGMVRPFMYDTTHFGLVVTTNNVGTASLGSVLCQGYYQLGTESLYTTAFTFTATT